ncbi:uncharacterized protein LOC130273370 isoform X1 [Hyla sarda]|uniref:uncharacterized protein LOC130273369 isoform X1 n=1 Tax=Hyla sarda TaxID=327740 RepID=UPI0024C3454F|nr:uncharacterized protein LOC130273369 isoform X1 [Hyla sarda]XP_056376040.1 uncharacterized protein LOC130273370 isoform X1 [Hyla sarda]
MVPAPIHTDLKPKSNFYPLQSRGSYLDTFLSMVAHDLEKLTKRDNKYANNLSRIEHQTLKKLAENRNIVIRPADKGGGVVILNTEDYIKEANRLLTDPKFYKTLPTDPTKKYTDELKTLVNEGFQTGVLNKSEKDFILIHEPSLPIFYYLPKVHKNTENPPGRPIVSGIGSVSSNLSHYLDLLLHKYVLKLTSYLKDTTDFISSILAVEWKTEYLLVTMDITSLYTVIDHDLGINAVAHFLNNDPELPQAQRDFIQKGLRYVLTHNYFEFQKCIYAQHTGTAMGSRVAPSFANLFVGLFEETFVYPNHLFRHCVYFKRFIDDIFFIWNGSTVLLDEFLTYLNCNNWGLHFTHNVFNDNAEFLDVVVFHNGLGALNTKTFFKKVDSNSYLDFTSSHFKKWLINVPYGQFKRIRRNCSNLNDFEEQSDILRKRFRAKKYPKAIVDSSFKRASTLSQQECLSKGKFTPSNEKDWSINFITTFSREHKHIKDILHKHWPIVMNDPFLRDTLPQKPGVTFRRGKTLRNIIAPSRLKTHNHQPVNFLTTTGAYRCGHNRCKCCANLHHRAKTFTSKITGETFQIKTLLNCSSQYVVYLLDCQCGLQYVGRTIRCLRERITKHRNNATNGFLLHSVSRHITEQHGQNFNVISITPIESISRDIPHRFNTLRKRENYWIYKLQTLVPTGLNEMIECSL